MNLAFKSTKFVKVSDIEIPERFFNRMKTGVPAIENIFGGSGLLPGSTFTISAAPGAGKTTLLLQIMERFEESGHNVAYASGEECVEQIAFTSQRIGVTNVPVANINTIEDLEELLLDDPNIDIVVLDSFQGIKSTKVKGSGKKVEEHIANQLVNLAHQTNTTIGIILHVTKSGEYKGSTQITHSVDACFSLSVDKDDPQIRVIDGTKNRYGGIKEVHIMMTSAGFDFNVDMELLKGAAELKASANKLAIIQLDDNGIMSTRAVQMVSGDSYTKAQKLISELTQSKLIKQEGRGKFTLTEEGEKVKKEQKELLEASEMSLDDF